MFYDPAQAAEFAASPKVRETMEHVRQFSFDKGLFGAGADSPDFVGISFPDGDILGEAANVKLRFEAGFMEMAAQ
jgi:NitT/TauT family transport system substrate-binding protein